MPTIQVATKSLYERPNPLTPGRAAEAYYQCDECRGRVLVSYKYCPWCGLKFKN